MLGKQQRSKPRVIHLLITLTMLLTALLSATGAQAAPLPAPAAAPPAEAAATTTVTLVAVEDQGMIESVPTFVAGGAPYFVLNGRPDTHSEDWNFIQFDLSALPADATIVGAQLKLDVIAFGGPPRDLEVGRVDGDWEEGVTSWSTMPAVTWGGVTQTITGTGDVTWPLKPLVEAWHSGAVVNNGVVVRSLDNGNNAGAQARTKDGAGDLPPRLVVTYSEPAYEGARPDLGDAPDSDSNHVGINNTAYPGGVLGHFPTVHEGTPNNEGAGPRHNNVTMEAILGTALTREGEADTGPDQDLSHNNILDGGADNADNDRGDDGWLNRNLRFFHCQRTQLEVRISKAPNATLNRMYLNVWFDGNRDGDWADLGQCQPDEDEPAQAAYEWIVQDYIVDLTSIPAGGFRDFSVLTEKVLNSSGMGRHWMRFTLSEAPAVRAPSGTELPDGRGPHPNHPTLKAFAYGETEDILQKSAPVGEDGTLEIQKRVITDSDPVEWIDYVTYEIRLRHNGGTQPMQVRLRDLLPYPLIVYPTIDGSGVHYVDVTSSTGGATPLQAQLDVIPPSGSTPPQQVVTWQGALAPDATLTFTFKVRTLALCQPNQQTMTFTNRAEALPKGGTAISAEATFTAKCIGYTGNNIQIDSEPIANPIDFEDLTHIPWRGTIHNLHPVSVTLGIYQKPLVSTADAAATQLDKTSPLLGLVTLGPNESKSVIEFQDGDDLFLKGVNELDLPTDYTVDLGLGYCLLPNADSTCPDAELYPQLHGQIPFTLTVRPNDLGDAPDSTNHAGVAMAAYPNGTQANFPTVFDPAAGLPPGPRHSYPRPFHLGERVSREAEADIGPDQDPLNNIVPATNNPDNDRADDGTNLALWNLNNCQTTNLPVRVAITPQAVNYFQQLGTPGYLNIWLDSNRDGDWADAAQCGQQPAPEHIVIDFPVDVVALGAGLQTLNVPTGLVPWQTTDKPAWVRITLSELPSNKTLQAGNVKYGDGRGYQTPFKTGETEDYYYRPLAAGGGPDLDVQLTASSRKVTAKEAALQAAAVDGKLGNFEIQLFKVDVTNKGTGVDGARLEFQIPEKLRGQQPALLRTAGIDEKSISFNAGKVSMILPYIEQNNLFTVVMGWYGCLTCTLASQVAAADLNADYTGVATVTVAGDVDTSNNESSATARGLLSSPIIGAFMDYTDDACVDHVISGQAATNRTSIALRGKAEPNQIIAILIGLQKVAEVTSDANGDFFYTANLGGGLYEISARYASIVSPRDPASGLPTGKLKLLVNPALPFDPLSVCFVDSHDRAYAVPTLGYSFGATQTGSWLRSGETYKVSLNANKGNLNQYFKVTFEDVIISSLKDEDGDGTYQGLVVMPDPGVQSASVNATGSLGLLAGDGATERAFGATVTTGTDGVISDRSTGQPLANASVGVLIAQAADDDSLFFTTWGADQSGQANPQVTGGDGHYNYSASQGSYRLDVVRDGYQSYRSATVDASTLNMNIALSPAIAEAATKQVLMTEQGFVPALLKANVGEVIEFINVDVAEHSATNNQWDSGILGPGQSYKVKVTAAGSYTYSDSAGAASGAIVVSDEIVPIGNGVQLFLPLVTK
ncbi:MAG: DNRLRE domain-containing protein [Caldilineaceae bacterium]